MSISLKKRIGVLSRDRFYSFPGPVAGFAKRIEKKYDVEKASPWIELDVLNPKWIYLSGSHVKVGAFLNLTRSELVTRVFDLRYRFCSDPEWLRRIFRICKPERETELLTLHFESLLEQINDTAYGRCRIGRGLDKTCNLGSRA